MLWALGSGLRARGSGLWALGSGHWALGSGLRAPGSGLRALGSGLWAPGSGRRARGSGLWAGFWAPGSGLRARGSEMSAKGPDQIFGIPILGTLPKIPKVPGKVALEGRFGPILVDLSQFEPRRRFWNLIGLGLWALGSGLRARGSGL